jgi:hypothetical protein
MDLLARPTGDSEICPRVSMASSAVLEAYVLLLDVAAFSVISINR